MVLKRNMEGRELKDLTTYIAKALVDKPEEVFVSEITGQQISVIELRVAAEDIGKIIGKEGRTAHALRTILHAAAMKTKMVINYSRK